MKRALRLISSAAGGYLLGTLPSADVASRLATRGSADLRSSGTRNPGGMNARRVLGHRIGAAVVVADIAKGVAACGWGRRRAEDVGAHVAGAAAVAGHCYPLWSGFRGGKGVATSFGQCLYTFPAYAPVDVALALAVVRVRACGVRLLSPSPSRPSLGSWPASPGGGAAFRISGGHDRRPPCRWPMR